MQVKLIIYSLIFLILIIVYFALPQVQFFFNGAFDTLASLNSMLFSKFPAIIRWAILGSMIALTIGILHKIYGENGK